MTCIYGDEVALAAISNSIRLQSDSTPLSESLSRQPCIMMRPVAFAWKTVLERVRRNPRQNRARKLTPETLDMSRFL